MQLNIEEQIIVKTKLGEICGLIKKSETKSFPDTEYYSFQGIRYAKAPLGPLRFRAPQPPEPWYGVYDATQEGNLCSQITLDGEFIGDEDCLFLNVYTPVRPGTSNELLPVMFWIHGGGYITGSGSQMLFGPDYLMPQKNIVLVTINYRLSVFGFLKCDDPNIRIPGNAGCKDVVMALKWVQNNIENFNGDPNNVIIWGQSAGANIAHSLILSPMAKGLFHKAILHSGLFFTKFFPGSTKIIWIMKMLSAAGYKTNNELEAFDLLSKLTSSEVAKVFATFREYEGSCGTGSIQYLTVESSLSLEEAYINQEFEMSYLENNINAVPIMVGTNADDGLVFTSRKESYGATVPELVAPNTITPGIIYFSDIDKNWENGKKIVNYYYGKEAPSRRNLDKYSRLSSDTAFNVGTKHFIQLYQMATTQPIYRFRFMLQSPYNLYKKMYNIQVPCVSHGDELTYLFHTKYSRLFRPNSVEEITLYRLVTLWTNFAKTGNPNLPANSLINVNWLPIQQGQLNHLNISKGLKYVQSDRDEQGRFKFWDDLLTLYYKSLSAHMLDKNYDDENINNIRFQLKLIKDYQDAKKSICDYKY